MDRFLAKVAVDFRSGYGHTAKQAHAVLASVQQVKGIEAHLITIDAEGNLPANGWETLAAADAIIMGSPTYIGSVSWRFKKFSDASSKP